MSLFPYINHSVSADGIQEGRMARQRTLDPGFFRNEELAELPFEARLLFAGLWTAADREGRLEDRPKRIKADLFPYDSVDVETALSALADLSMIRRYRVKGAPLIAVLNFPKFQRCHPREKPSILPGPELADPDEVCPGSTLGKPIRGQAVLSNAGSSGPSGSSDCIAVTDVTAHSAQAELSPIQDVFLAWCSATGRNGRTKLTDERVRKIKARLKDYPLEDVRDGAAGIGKHPWNAEHQQTELTLALRDGEHLEKFRDVWRGITKPIEHVSRAERAMRDKIANGSPEYLAALQETYGDGSL